MSLDRRHALALIASGLPVTAAGGALGQVPAPKPAARPTGGPLPEVPRLAITPAVAARVGRQVWLNESGGRIEGLTAWNDAEDFPSLGIGHWIWFKAGGHPLFEESFPKLVAFMRERGANPPVWLARRPVPPCPWPSKAAFMREFNAPRLAELRRFLADTVPLQTEYLLVRAEAAIPKMLATLSAAEDRARLLSRLADTVRASPDLYPLIDYVNFKGEGFSEKETSFDATTGRREGWGLKHLLLEMRPTPAGAPVLAEFSRAAKYVLDRRIRNHPPSQRWRAGWHKRCDTYARPLA
jgi:hypothetical protein